MLYCIYSCKTSVLVIYSTTDSGTGTLLAYQSLNIYTAVAASFSKQASVYLRGTPMTLEIVAFECHMTSGS